MKHYFYLYEIRNNTNGKIYVGVHKTRNLEDGYMGSGKVIKQAIEKHGIDNFTKTILERFDSSEEMYAREKEVVNEEFLNREDTYNLRRGGSGGFDYINKNCGSQGGRLNETLSAEKRRLGGANAQSKFRSAKKGVFADDWVNPFKGRSKEFSERARIVNLGSMWINDGSTCKKIKKDSPIPEGWRRGRIRGLGD